MVIFSGELDKAIAAFIIANGAASMGHKVTMFFTFWGLNILRKSKAPKVKKNLIEAMFGWMMPRGADKLILSKMHMAGMGTGMIKWIMKKKNVNSLPELIESAIQNGVHVQACQMSMDLMGIRKEELLDNIETVGVATFIHASDESNATIFI
jgi:peroxiredoxin family protein